MLVGSTTILGTFANSRAIEVARLGQITLAASRRIMAVSCAMILGTSVGGIYLVNKASKALDARFADADAADAARAAASKAIW